MKNIKILIILFAISACQHKPQLPLQRDLAAVIQEDKLQRKAVKEFFLNVTKEERADAMARAEIFWSDHDPATISKINVLDENNNRCGETMMVQPNDNEEGYYKWNTVSCDYHPDVEKSLGGGGVKFLCDFADAKAKDGIKTKKVRYGKPRGPVESEILETTVGQNMALLLGMPTKTTCPAIVECKGCPSENPWHEAKAAAKPKAGSISFDWALVESNLDAYIISIPFKGNAPNGLSWNELKTVKADTAEESKRMLTEREAWMTYVSFIQATDAGDFNLRLSCLQVEKVSDTKYYCTKPIVYLHDYGHAFYRHMNYNKWASIPVFQNKRGICKLGLTRDTLPHKVLGLFGKEVAISGIILGATISSEGRDILFNRLSQITDEQWTAIFKLSRTDEALKISAGTWLKDIKAKIEQLRVATCKSFDEGNSVLK